MALDNAQFISELSITDPPGTDPLSEGDDQIRTTKRATFQSFPNVDAQVDRTAAELNDVALKSVPNTFVGLQDFTSGLVIGNDEAYFCRDTGASAQSMLFLNATDVVFFGNPGFDMITRILASGEIQVGGAPAANFVPRASGGLLVSDIVGVERKVGFRQPPRNEITASRTAVQGDEGQVIDVAVAGLTFTLDQLEVGTAITLINRASGSITIAAGTASLQFHDGSGGTPPTGNRTFAQAGVCQLWWVSAVTVIIWGNGLT